MFRTQALHTNFREVAELTLLFNTDTWYTLKCFIQVLGILLCDSLRCENFRTDRYILYEVTCTGTCYNDLTQLQRVFLQFKVSTCAFIVNHINLKFLLLIASKRSDDYLLSDR